MALKELLTDLNSFYQNFPLHGEFNYGAGTKAANGTFDQKSKKFGQGTASDQPKGGFSNQPYITVDIPEGDDNYSFPLIGSVDGGTSNVLNIINTVSDGFVRGGLITATARSATDVVRLSKFGIDLTRGPEFIAKQIALQRSNTKWELSQSFIAQTTIVQDSFSGIPSFISNTIFDGVNATNSFQGAQNRLYNAGVNTLAQIGINASGVHLKRHGLFPQVARGEDDPTGYARITKNGNQSTNFENNNRLLILKDSLERFNTQDTEKVLYSYSGGPGSVYGIGRTNIMSYLNTLNSEKLQITAQTGNPLYDTKSTTTEKSTLFFPLDIPYILFGGETFTDKTNIDSYTKKQYTGEVNVEKIVKPEYEESTAKLFNYLSLDQPTSQTQKTVKGSRKIVSLNDISDFREIKSNNLPDGDLKTYYQNVSSNYGQGGNMESRLGIGTGFDTMGELPIIKTAKRVNSKSEFEINGTQKSTRDLVKFFIEAVDNDYLGVFDHIQFRAFLEGMGDNYRAKWDSYNFIGNPEPFFNYKSIDRGIDLSFKIVAFSLKELKPLYTRLNALISNLMPDYAKDNTRARAPYVRLTVGSYFDRLPGFIESLSIDWDKEYSWDIGIVKSGEIDETNETQVLPHILDVKMKFQPVHNFIPRKVKANDSDVPFITLNSRNGNEGKVWIGDDDNFFITEDAQNIIESTDKARAKSEQEAREARERKEKQRENERKKAEERRQKYEENLIAKQKEAQEKAQKALEEEKARQEQIENERRTGVGNFKKAGRDLDQAYEKLSKGDLIGSQVEIIEAGLEITKGALKSASNGLVNFAKSIIGK